ncbi:MAG: T9SS type A sorting domain-containing protein, partial [Candidatus Cloacimonetes bacterium]|nr:T9SS type A sorting domain-containing protein [Candidatus Cloacimonadota bacterium]
CYSTGIVSGEDFAGGLVGTLCNSVISNCYSTGSVVVSDSYAGGFVGKSLTNSTISNCYSTGSVEGVDFIAGFAGACITNTTINKCYSTGNVFGFSLVGGFVGGCSNSSLSDCFWDTETSNQATSAGGTGRTTLEMHIQSTFTDAGWDFMDETVNGIEDYWGINSNDNNAYPFLEWQGYVHDPPVSNNDATEILLVTCLHSNYPNPFNPETTINFSVKHQETATLEIYNVRGQTVKNYPVFESGTHSIVWQGTNNKGKQVGSGIYFYKLKSGSTEQVRKMLLLK